MKSNLFNKVIASNEQARISDIPSCPAAGDSLNQLLGGARINKVIASKAEASAYSHYTEAELAALASVVTALTSKIKTAQDDLNKLNSNRSIDNACNASIDHTNLTYCGVRYYDASAGDIYGNRHFAISMVSGSPISWTANTTKQCDTYFGVLKHLSDRVAAYPGKISAKNAEIVKLNADLKTAQDNYKKAVETLTPEQKIKAQEALAEAQRKQAELDAKMKESNIMSDLKKYAGYLGIAVGGLIVIFGGYWAYQKYLKKVKPAAA